MAETLDYDQKDKITELLVGHKITKIADNKLELDDGRVLTFVGNAECCAYYDLVELNGVDNIITNVEFFDSPFGDYTEGEGVYRIFVFAENVKINLASFEGTDSSGYYGTGYWIEVS